MTPGQRPRHTNRKAVGPGAAFETGALAGGGQEYGAGNLLQITYREGSRGGGVAVHFRDLASGR